MKRDSGANIPNVRFSTRVFWLPTTVAVDCLLWWIAFFSAVIDPSVRTFWIFPPQCVSYSAFPRKKSILFSLRHWA